MSDIAQAFGDLADQLGKAMVALDQAYEERARLRAEVERLRGLLKDADDRWGDEEKKAVASEAEVERLREVLREKNGAIAEAKASQAEVERLRALLKDADGRWGDEEKKAVEAEAEVERLRAELDFIRAERDRYQAALGGLD